MDKHAFGRNTITSLYPYTYRQRIPNVNVKLHLNEEKKNNCKAINLVHFWNSLEIFNI